MSNLAPKKHNIGIKLGKGYKSVTIYHFHPKSRELEATDRLEPNPKFGRREKFNVICKQLIKSYGLDPITYIPTRKEP